MTDTPTEPTSAAGIPTGPASAAVNPTEPEPPGVTARGAATSVPDVAGLIEVAPQSTVSRTVLRSQGVRVVAFSFDAGQELTEHTAAVPVLLQVLDGLLRVGAGEDSIDLAPGGLVHLPARLPHTVLALLPSILMLTMLDPRQS